MTAATRLDTLTLVPPARFGRLLGDARADRRCTLAEVAAATGGRFEPADLSRIEAGGRTLLDTEVTALLDAYGLDVATPPPRRTRLVVDAEEGWVVLNSTTGRSAPGGARSASGGAVHVDVLSRYLGLIYRLRRAQPGTNLALRQADLDVLADVLRNDPAQIEERLVKLMRNPGDTVGRRARRFERRLIVPAAGVLVAATVAGALVLESRGSDPRPGVTVPVAHQLGEVVPFGPRATQVPPVDVTEVSLIPAAVVAR